MPVSWVRFGSGGIVGAGGFDVEVQRVPLSGAGLPWPHYFVDLGGFGGSAGTSGNLVVIAACTQRAPGPSVSATPSGPTPAASSTPSTPQGCLHPELVGLNL